MTQFDVTQSLVEWKLMVKDTRNQAQKIPGESSFRSNLFPEFFYKIWLQRAPNFEQGPKNSLRNPAYRYSKPCKMETYGPRDLKLGLK